MMSHRAELFLLTERYFYLFSYSPKHGKESGRPPRPFWQTV